MCLPVTFGVFFSSILIGQTHSQEIMQRVVDFFFVVRFFLGWVLFRGGEIFFKLFKWEEVFLFIYLLSLRGKHHPHLGFVFYNGCSVMFLGEDWSGISRVFLGVVI